MVTLRIPGTSGERPQAARSGGEARDFQQNFKIPGLNQGHHTDRSLCLNESSPGE